ncbi:hypothetical protein [Treponema sp.]|uniref:hypothetical protein n=1 Tax=Treponema sp. TaxID=166 RepID=UPI003FD7EE20
MQKLLRKTAIILILLAATFTVSAQTESYITENSQRQLKIMTLPNGFRIYFLKDAASPVFHAEFLSCAGFSAQTASTTGLAPLFAKLTGAECLADCTKLSADFAADYLETALSQMAAQVTKPFFSDEDLKRYYNELRSEVNKNARSSSGFINRAIDSRIFRDAPWKHESGIYPALFGSKTIPEVRTALYDMAARYYRPELCALFISAGTSEQSVYNACLKAFGNWESAATAVNTACSTVNNAEKTEEAAVQKKFVLVSEEFPDDMTQIAVQYTTLPFHLADLAAAALNAGDSDFKKSACTDSTLSIRSADYTDVSSARKKGSSRLIFQALMENPAQNPPPFQAQAFTAATKEMTQISRSEFVGAQKKIDAKNRKLTSAAASEISLLADFWAASPLTDAAHFYENFLESFHKIHSAHESQIAEYISKEEPFVFVLVGKKLYAKNRAQFEKLGYETVTQKNASWYDDKLILAKALENAAEKKEEVPLKKEKSGFSRNESRTQIKTFTLSNGIPCVLHKTQGSMTSSVSVSIDSDRGMLLPSDMRTVLVNALAQKIQEAAVKENIADQTVIKSWRESGTSFITIDALSENLGALLEAAVSSLIYEEISPSAADTLIGEWNAQKLMAEASLSNQMKTAAYSVLYAGQIPQDNSLSQIEYKDILLGYSTLLDASLYSISISGGIDFSKTEGSLKKTFGLLKNRNIKNKETQTAPEYKPRRTATVKLRHTYTSDLPAELAPKESPILVPTKEFSDPAQIYFIPAQNSADCDTINALAIELAQTMNEQTQTDLFYARAGTQTEPCMIECRKTKSRTFFLDAYKNACTHLLKKLSGDKKDATLLKIKNGWTTHFMKDAQTDGGISLLMLKGMRLSQNPQMLTDSYETMRSAGAESFIKILEGTMDREQAFVIFSADTKK